MATTPTVNPAFAAAIDMRKISPAGKLVYYGEGPVWQILRAKRSADRKQMHEHCDKLIKSPEYRGAAYSVGDEFIHKCAIKKAGPSTLTKWKEVGINHHIMHVLEDIFQFRREAINSLMDCVICKNIVKLRDALIQFCAWAA